MGIILADNQDITCAGLRYLIESEGWQYITRVGNRRELVSALLKNTANSIIILDYSLFDFSSVDSLLVVNSRFEGSMWILFGDDLSQDMLKRLIVNEHNFSILSKNASNEEIKRAINDAILGHRYIAQDAINLLLANGNVAEDKLSNLTDTEKEILIAIASGKTSREIADIRFSSINTIITHRKNIFRKIKVNNAYEATRYALRTGLVSQSDYYI